MIKVLGISIGISLGVSLVGALLVHFLMEPLERLRQSRLARQIVGTSARMGG